MKQLFLILTIVIFSITSSMAQMQKTNQKWLWQEMQAHKGSRVNVFLILPMSK